MITYSDKPKIRDHRKASQERVNVCSCKWPYYYFEFNPQTNFYIERKSLVKKGLSLFPSWYHAAHHFLNLGEKPTSIADFRSLIMIVPDPRIAIEKIYLQGKNVKIVVQEGTLDIKDIMVKIYSSLRERYNADIEFKISNKETIYELPYDPDCLSIHIIESEDFDLDHREIDFEWGLTSSGVIIERSEETLLQYLEMGEGQHVEFKESLDDKGLRDKMTKAVSSFANTTGGILFLGVNDEGVPVKSIEKNEADRISQICSELIDSFIKLEFKFLPAQGFEILAILVSEGTEKPYVVKDRGVFVRYNGTTKHADRSQLLSMCPK